MFPSNSKNVDLVETTLKVVEDEEQEQQNLAMIKENIEHYQNYIKHLKKGLKKNEVHNVENTQILELNNFTKNTFNVNCKTVKEMFEIVHKFTRDIEQDLCSIKHKINVDLYNENETRLVSLKEKYKNEVGRLEVVEQEFAHKLTGDMKKLRDEIDNVDKECKKYDELWNNMIDKHDEQLSMLQNIKTEIEIVQDNIEVEMKQLTELKDKHGHAVIEEIAENHALKEKILEEENEVVKLLDEINESMRREQQMKQELSDNEKFIEKQEQMIAEYRNADEVAVKKADDLIKEIESNEQLKKQYEHNMEIYKKDAEQLEREKQEVSVKLVAITDENSQNQEEDQVQVIQANIELILKQNEVLDAETEKLLQTVAHMEIEVPKKQKQLEEIKFNESAELGELNKQLQLLEKDQEDQDDESKEIERRISDLQLTIEELEKNIQVYELVMQQETKNQITKEKESDNLTAQCDTLKKEIGQIKSANQKFLAPPKPVTKRKRQSVRHRQMSDFESDSSYEGEKMTHSELLARMKRTKKKLK